MVKPERMVLVKYSGEFLTLARDELDAEAILERRMNFMGNKYTATQVRLVHQPLAEGGEWSCECGKMNEGFRDKCRTCFQPRELSETKPQEGEWVCSYCYNDIELQGNPLYTQRKVERFKDEYYCEAHCGANHGARANARPMKLPKPTADDEGVSKDGIE